MKIGILGGIGPEATSEFYSKLIFEIQRRGIKSNRDFPQIIINSIPAPELINDNVSQEELSFYRKGLAELDSFGVDFIVMVCNTIHLFYDELQEGIKSPIIDLRKAVYDKIKNAKAITVLGTPLTVKKLYKFEGIKTINPVDDELSELSSAIFNYNKGVEKEKQKEFATRLSNKYLKLGSEKIVLGCTELAVMLKGENFVNTLDVLVKATLKRFI